MPRHAEIPGVPATEVIKVRLTKTDVAKIDKARGNTPRSTWLRDLARAQTTVVPKGGSSSGRDADSPEPSPAPHAGSAPSRHKHRRGALLSEVGLKGQTTRTYRCAEPGCTKELTS